MELMMIAWWADDLGMVMMKDVYAIPVCPPKDLSVRRRFLVVSGPGYQKVLEDSSLFFLKLLQVDE